MTGAFDQGLPHQLTQLLLAQFTPFYIAALLGIVGLGAIVIASYSGKASMPRPLKIAVQLILAAILVLFVQRCSANRATMHQLVHICGGSVLVG